MSRRYRSVTVPSHTFSVHKRPDRGSRPPRTQTPTTTEPGADRPRKSHQKTATPGQVWTVRPLLRIRRSSAGGDDTHNRHQRIWTLPYSGGPLKTVHARPWTVLDNLAVLCKQEVTAIDTAT